jgi:NAD kinase/molybdopterin-binding protein
MANAIDRCVVVTRKTQLQELMLRHNTKEQARFYLQSQGDDFVLIEQRHDTYMAALAQLKSAMPTSMKLAVIDRSFLPQFEFLNDVVFAIGQDGLVSNTAKYLTGQPLIGVNPDPDHIEGVLLPWRVDQAERLLAKVIAERHSVQHVTLAEARLNDGRTLRAFNDLFIGQAGHSSAVYNIEYVGVREFQSSSGIIVSTGAGSTGWMRSIYTGSTKLVSNAEFADDIPVKLARDADALMFAVREPWPSKKTGTSIVSGAVTADVPLEIQSRMAANGVIFSDGIEWDYLEFNEGTHATISVAADKVQLVVR